MTTVAIDQLFEEITDELSAWAHGHERRGSQPAADEERREGERLVTAAVERANRDRLVSGGEPLTAPEEASLAEELRARLFGFGALERLLADPSIENLHANGADRVFITRAGGEHTTGPSLAASDADLVELIRRVAALGGRTERRFDDAKPLLSLRLPDGSRLAAVMHVAARPSLSIRRHRHADVSLADLVELGALDEDLAAVMAAAVCRPHPFNIVVAGGTDAGKTTFLRALLAEVEPWERLVVIEDALELQLERDGGRHPNVVELETREPNVEGAGEITMRDLARHALRMAPDRVIVGEVRGGEVLEMLLAMSQGNDGSMCTLHADSSSAALTKIATYALMAPERMPIEATNLLIAQSVNLVVHLDRLPDGTRVVSSLREVTGADGRLVVSNEVFGPGVDGRARSLHPFTTRSLERLVANGLDPRAPRRVGLVMTTLAAGLLGCFAGLGLLVVVLGWRGLPAGVTRGRRRHRRLEQLNLRVGLAVGAAVIVGAVTRWPVASVAAAVFGWTAPTLLGARSRRRRDVERTEAVARWAEQLRDTMSAAAGLHEAIGVTARVAPLAIRAEVQELAARLRREPLAEATRHFAAQVANPAGDQVAVALILASERHGARLVRGARERRGRDEGRGGAAPAHRGATGPHLQPGPADISRHRRRRSHLRRAQPGLPGSVRHPERPARAGRRLHPVVRVVLGARPPGRVHARRAAPRPSGQAQRWPDGGGRVIVVLLLGMTAGLGLWLVARGWRPAGPTLEAALAGLARPSALAGGAHRGSTGIRQAIAQVALLLGGDRVGRAGLAADLALIDRTPEAHAVDKLQTALFGAAVPVAMWFVSTWGHPISAGVAGTAAIGLGLGGWFLSDLQAAAKAKVRRRQFRAVLAVYLRLVTVLLAGGSGTEEALQDAAAHGEGWGFALLRRCVNDARLAGRSPWSVMQAVAERTALDDLAELAAAMSLAGEAGAQVRRSLEAAAGALTERELADIDAEAAARTERMNAPVALLVVGFVVLIIFPGVYSVVHL